MATKLEKLARQAEKLSKSLKEVMAENRDYDLVRLLKKIDAELMDLRHNLNLAKRLSEKTKS